MRYIHNRVSRYFILTLVLLGIVLTSCANQAGTSLAQEACVKVNKSIAIYDSAVHTANPATRNTLMARSLSLLRAAMPTSAIAAGEDPSWQALSATLSESSRVPESYIIHALSRECTVIDSGASSPPPPQPAPDIQPSPGATSTTQSGSSYTGSNSGNSLHHNKAANSTPSTTSNTNNNSHNVPVKKTLSRI